jgi:hypothetical protein
LFEKYWNTLATFLREEGLGALSLLGTDLTYVNHIPAGQGWSEPNEIGEIFPDLSWRRRDRNLGDVRGFAWHGSFHGADVRLEADIKTGTSADSDKKLMYIFELRAASQKKPGSKDAVCNWFRTANETIVSAFVDLTSERMRKEIWHHVDG